MASQRETLMQHPGSVLTTGVAGCRHLGPTLPPWEMWSRGNPAFTLKHAEGESGFVFLRVVRLNQGLGPTFKLWPDDRGSPFSRFGAGQSESLRARIHIFIHPCIHTTSIQTYSQQARQACIHTTLDRHAHTFAQHSMRSRICIDTCGSTCSDTLAHKCACI